MSLTKIQNELHVPKGQKNSYGKYNYRSNEDIQVALKPILEQFDATFFISYEVKEVCGVAYSEATCTLKVGKEEYITKGQAGIEKNGGMALPQAYGSAHSYASKYACASLFLLDDVKDSDSENTHNKTPKKAPVDEVDYIAGIKKLCDQNKLKFEDVQEWANTVKNKDINISINAKALTNNWSKILPEINEWLIREGK